MKITAICVTFNRPELLAQMIRCFELQTYENRELIILDDAGQYKNTEGDRWRLTSVDRRFPTLGAKRNAAMSLASPDTTALAVWDDDDTYLPWALAASVAALEKGYWARSSQVWEKLAPGEYKHVESFSRENPDHIAYHGCWSFRRDVFNAMGGYPLINTGEDIKLTWKIIPRLGSSVDTISKEFPDPFFIYNRTNASSSISELAHQGVTYDDMASIPITKVAKLTPRWPDDYCRLPAGTKPQQRPF